jgi:hypothetical protein
MPNGELIVRTAKQTMTNIDLRAFIVSYPPESNRQIGFGQVRALKSPRTRKDRREFKNGLRIPACGWDHNQIFFFGANSPWKSATPIAKGFPYLSDAGFADYKFRSSCIVSILPPRVTNTVCIGSESFIVSDRTGSG